MEKFGPDFYDVAEVFDTYMTHRARDESPNETIEQPILWKLIGDVRGLKVLDLGCGDARVSRKFKALGAQCYLGVEGSKRMVEKAQGNVDNTFSTVTESWLETYEPPAQKFDLIVSSLVFHYIDNLSALLDKAYRALKPGGRIVFSTASKPD